MAKAKRARKAETPKQPSPCLRLRAPYLYPDPGPRDGGVSKSLHLRTRGTPMCETLNDYIDRVKTFSTLLRRSHYAHHIALPLDRLTPLRPEDEPPK